MIYSIAQRGTVTASGSFCFDIASPTARGILALIMEVGVFLGAATASTYGLSRSTTLGTRTSPLALISETQGNPALTGITLIDSAIAWGAQPTIASAEFRRIGLPATIGTGVIWTFPRGIQLQAQLAVGVVNRATNSAATDCYAAADV